MVTETIEDAKSLEIKVIGKESFNYRNYKQREDESSRNYYTILDHSVTLAKFHNRTVAPG